MILSDIDVLKRVNDGSIKIDPPLIEEHLGGMSLDLRLGRKFRIFRESFSPCIEIGPSGKPLNFPMSDDLMEIREIEGDNPFYLHPNQLALGITLESITLSKDIVGFIDGRSSLARVGLMVNITAHTIEPGWEGNITLEFANLGRVPLALYPGARICALRFEQLSSPARQSYDIKQSAKYLRQNAPHASRISQE
uniref:dCTP deaminase n=1 Tax=Candidatus Kentrum sp. TUN TaxID=2126343 RepID=A0A450ZUC1_9GAMM|nr:MAG: dCTP deaminase [Candidatus Kentron sp. TUN]VFK56310.1 MAG: dCTP deaminase [Candidatus Kentron sp. TUN]VFK57353.1 MAG: dCTP deaminase [Candidatus Kentron sp. TUN]